MFAHGQSIFCIDAATPSSEFCNGPSYLIPSAEKIFEFEIIIWLRIETLSEETSEVSIST